MGVAAKPYGAFGTAAHSSCGNGKAVSSADWGEPAGCASDVRWRRISSLRAEACGSSTQRLAVQLWTRVIAPTAAASAVRRARVPQSFQQPTCCAALDCIIICPSGRVDPGRCSAGSKDPTACRSRRCNRACRRGRPPPESRGREVEGRRARWAAAAQCNDMIQALATDRSDQPLGKTVLPRRARRYGLVADAHGP